MRALYTRIRRNPKLFGLARAAVYTLRSLYGKIVGCGLRPWRVRQYFRRNAVRKLHIGCGDAWLPGWLNTDGFPRNTRVTYLDATGELSFAKGGFDYVYSEHMIEHIPFPAARRMVKLAFQALKPGGVLRVSTPDLDRILALKTTPPDALQRAYIEASIASTMPEAINKNPCFLLNIFVREWGHAFIYDRDTLTALLEDAGFVDVVVRDIGESRHPALRGLEQHGAEISNSFRQPRPIGDAFNRIETMILEATKPPSPGSLSGQAQGGVVDVVEGPVEVERVRRVDVG